METPDPVNNTRNASESGSIWFPVERLLAAGDGIFSAVPGELSLARALNHICEFANPKSMSASGFHSFVDKTV